MFGECDSWEDFPGCETIISIDVRDDAIPRISCKIPIFQTLGGWGGVPRSVNGLNIYTLDLDCMFATVLYFPWVLHCFPRFSFVLIPFLTYVIILSWVCTAHFASRAMFWFLTDRTAKMLRNFAEKHGPRFWGENNLDFERSHDHCSHKKAGIIYLQ